MQDHSSISVSIYIFCYEIDARGRQIIRNAMKAWQNHVCVHFKEREQEAGYINFFYNTG